MAKNPPRIFGHLSNRMRNDLGQGLAATASACDWVFYCALDKIDGRTANTRIAGR
jgi:hypothetical protein